MIDKDSIAKMKVGVILLNTARGPLVCESDLADALKSGKVFYAAMDVVETEPIPKDSVLLTAPKWNGSSAIFRDDLIHRREKRRHCKFSYAILWRSVSSVCRG